MKNQITRLTSPNKQRANMIVGKDSRSGSPRKSSMQMRNRMKDQRLVESTYGIGTIDY